MRILLVEDNPVDRIFVTQSLKQVESFEHDLVQCDTLEKDLGHVATSRFDVILLDRSVVTRFGGPEILSHGRRCGIKYSRRRDDRGE